MIMLKTFSILGFLFVLAGDGKGADDQGRASPPTEAPSYTADYARSVVSKAEAIRNIESASLEIDLKTLGGGQDTHYVMRVMRAAGKRALVDFLSPAAEVGRKMLVVGDRYWAKFPDSRMVHPISRREMLGNSVFSLVDLFQIDAESEYEPEITAVEEVEGVSCYVVRLLAKSDAAPYASITYFISQKDYFPVRAHFHSALGRRIKTLVASEDRAKLLGRDRPASFTMHDDVVRGRKSVWTTKNAKSEEFLESMFSPQFLRQ